MGLNLYIPNVTKDKMTVKDCIVQILSQDWPLTIRKIYHQVKKRFGFDCTYQAVFKALKELDQIGVVNKDDEGYLINMKWLKSIHSFTETTETNYFTKSRMGGMGHVEGIKDSKKEGNISILTFSTLFDVEKYLYYLQKDYMTKAGKPIIVCYHHNHEWRPLYYMRAEYNWIRKVREMGNRYYILCANNTIVDKYSARFYKSIGCSIKLNVNCASTCELMIVGDLVIEVYVPHNIISAMDREFSKVKTMAAIRPENMIKDIFEKEQDIEVILKKDPNIAEQIRKYTLKMFGGKK